MQRQSFLEAEIFGKSKLRFVDDFFQTGKAGEREAIDRERTDLAERGIRLQSRPAAFLMYERQHRSETSRLGKHAGDEPAQFSEHR
jgi:predicted N-acyltransferase